MIINERIDEKYLNQDPENPSYIFHGSKELFNTLKINKSSDLNGNKQNEQIGIYGSSSFFGAVPYAIKGRGNYDCQIGYKKDDLKMKISYGVIPEEEYGYIYVCEASNFTRCNDTYQYVSDKEIKPIEIIKIYYKYFKECFEYIEKEEVIHANKTR